MTVDAEMVAKRIGCSVKSIEIYTRRHELPFRLWYGGGPGRPRKVYVMEEVEAWLAAGKKPKIGRRRKSREVGGGSGNGKGHIANSKVERGKVKVERRSPLPTLSSPSRCAGSPLRSSAPSAPLRTAAPRSVVKKKRSWYLHNPEVEARAREAMARRRARKAEEERGEREGIRGGRHGAPSAFGTSPGGGGGDGGVGGGVADGVAVCQRCGEEKVASPRWWCDSCLEVAGRLQKRGMTMVQIAASGELDAEPDGGEHGLGWRGIRSDVVIGERYWQPRDD